MPGVDGLNFNRACPAEHNEPGKSPRKGKCYLFFSSRPQLDLNTSDGVEPTFSPPALLIHRSSPKLRDMNVIKQNKEKIILSTAI